MRRRGNRRRLIKTNNKVVILTCLAITIGLLFFSVIFSLINMSNSKVINGIKIDQVDISNLSR